MNHCMRHYEEPVAGMCRVCNRPFCNRCLVFAFGPDKPPYCIGCALAASGVRGSLKNQIPIAAAPEAHNLDRAQRRAEKAQARATTKALKKAAKKGGKPILGGDKADQRGDAVPAPPNLTTPAASRYSPQGQDIPVS